MKAIPSILIFLFTVIIIHAQTQVPVGAWRDHLPYQNCTKVVKIGTKLFCANPLTIMCYDTKDNSIEKLNKINGLSDAGIAAMDYYPAKDILLIAYTNGNIDIIKDKVITNISDFKRKAFAGEKKANSIYFHDNYAYLCCTFGILVVDLEKFEIKDTYNISENGVSIPVNALTSDNDYFYAATEKGIFKAGLNDPYLVNYTRWQRQTNIPNPTGTFNQIVTFNNTIITNSVGKVLNTDTMYMLKDNTWGRLPTQINTSVRELRAINESLLVTSVDNIYWVNKSLQIKSKFNPSDPESIKIHLNSYSALIDADSTIWVADYYIGLAKKTITGDYSFMFPNGPTTSNVRRLVFQNGQLLVTGGGTDASWGQKSKRGELSVFRDEVWTSYLNDSTKDFMVAASDPLDPSKIYVGSWGYGLMEYVNGKREKIYNQFNSSLMNIPGYNVDNLVRIGGLTFDNDNNLWIVNSEVSSPISVFKKDGTWKSFAYMKYLNVMTIGDIHYDNYGQFWVIMPRGIGLFVFDTKGTIDNEDDDVIVKFKPKDVYGDPCDFVYSVTSDRDGNVWVGTNKGPVVYSNPTDIISGVSGSTDGYQPTLSRKDTSQIADALLGTETINSIAIDGANRKWFATEKGGAYLFSADGTQEILHFNSQNSPLISDNIVSIAINDNTGEVYFGTDHGIMSYRAIATKPKDNLANAYVFPNPVRPEYFGDIVVSKLVENTSVKITDISGNLVYQTKSLGGQAIWDGKNKKGNKVATGVYLIFLSNEDGSDTNVIKLLVVK